MKFCVGIALPPFSAYNVYVPEVILQTKLNIPPLRPSLIERTQLINKLNDGLLADGSPGASRLFNRKLTLISAPAGFGKTTLISSWIHQVDVPAAWLSLDEGDNEPNRFVYYVIAALQQAHSELGESALSLLQSPQPPPIETLLTLLINDLANMAGQIILVFDDYHVIRELDVHKALTFLLDNQPPQLHLVVVSREDPAIPLHRLRGSGQMFGIYERELRFSAGEAAEFFDKTMGLNLTRGEVNALERRTEGWVAGLQLAALSMQDLPETRGFVSSFAGDDRYIADYLLAEVLERQPAGVQDFLIDTAILDRFCAALCDAILGTGDRGLGVGDVAERTPGDLDNQLSSQAIIEHLDQVNLFIVPLDNKREWYRYHHLFSDFLRLRLQEQPAGEIAALHRRAADWYEDNGLLAEAIEHALMGEDFERAGRLIEQNALTTIFGHAGWATLVGWMEALPVEVVRSHPQLSLQYAWALFTTGQWESVEPLLTDVEANIDISGEMDAGSLLRGEVGTLRAWLAFEIDKLALCIDLADMALELLPDDALMLRSLAILAQGVARFWLGQFSDSRPYLENAVEVGLRAGNLAVALMAKGCQVHTAVRQGRLREAARLYYEARQQGTVEGIALLSPAGYACVQMGEVLREWGRLQEARSLLEEGVQLCQKAGSPEMAIEGQMTLARVLLTAGDESGAANQISLAESDLLAWLGQGGALQYSMIKPSLVHRARYWLATGEAAKAAGWLEEIGFHVVEDLPLEDDDRYLVLARVLIAEQQAGKVKDLLNDMLPTFERDARLGIAVEALLLTSIASQACGERELAIRSLSRALRLAEAEGYRRIFLDESESLIELLRDIARGGQAAAYARTILYAIQDERQSKSEATSTATVPDSAQTELIEPLTEQELRILRLLAARLTNREIAAELFLSINTIKTYTSRIYGKLGVHSRTEAVDRANELGLL